MGVRMMMLWTTILLILMTGLHLKVGKKLKQGKKLVASTGNGVDLMDSLGGGIEKDEKLAKIEAPIGMILVIQKNIYYQIDK
nr:hypothetical protein [uncultured Desulfobacter sp.]